MSSERNSRRNRPAGRTRPNAVGRAVIEAMESRVLLSGEVLDVSMLRAASSPAFETTPTLGRDSVGEFVVYTARNLLPSGTFDQGDIWYVRIQGNAMGTPVQVTAGTTDDKLNDVSGDYIVYTAYDSPASFSGRIMLYQLSTGTSQPLGSASVVQEPRICGKNVVWREGGSFATQIKYYSLDWIGTEREPQVIDGPIPPTFGVDIGDRFVVWSSYRSTQYDVVAYDLNAQCRRPITETLTASERDPVTDGPWIVWQAQDQGKVVSRIMARNMDTGEERVLVSNGARNFRPSISGDLVAFESDLAGNLDIYVSKLSTGETFQVTTDPNDQYLSDVFGSTIAFVDPQTGDEDVWIAQLDWRKIVPKVSIDVTPADSVYPGESVTLRASFSDMPGEPYRAVVDWGDGQSSVIDPVVNDSVVAAHSYAEGGAYTVSVSGHCADATPSASLNVNVLTPVQALGDLISDVQALGFVQNVESSLTGKLEAAARLLNQDIGNDTSLSALLDAFIRGVDAWYSKGKMTQSARDLLASEAEMIKAAVLS